MAKEYTMKQWALAYANKGLAVFPLQSHGKAPLTQNGCKDATTDKKQIEEWWNKHPNANIGIATGYISAGLLVIDLDIDEDKGINGYDTLKRWEVVHGKLPDSWQSITGRGGYHLFYWSLELIYNRVKIMEGIDIRGEGGYIVAPPSIHPNGKRYEWEQSPDEFELVEAPDIVLAFLNQKSEEQKSFTSPITIPEGERNNILFKMASCLQARGLDGEAIMAAVSKENERKCQPPLSDKEIKKLVNSALKYESGNFPYYKTVYDKGAFKPVKPKGNLDIITAKDLQGLDIPPLKFIVEKLLPLGLIVLGAPPKSFKSYMCLDMCLSICQGLDFLGFKTKKCSCLYLDLESTRRRPKTRLEQILKGQPAPDNLYIATKAEMLGNGFEDQLRREKTNRPDIEVVVVDVFKRIRPGNTKIKDNYERDYEDYGMIKALADELNISIVLVTHTTKMKHPDDPFNELTGSAGVMGSIDVAWIIRKEKREDEIARFYITGRDLEEQCYEMKFSKIDYRWNKLGAHKDMEQLRKELDYKTSPIIGTIRKLVEQNRGNWKGTASEIIKASQYFGLHIHDKAQQVGQRINEFAEMLREMDCIDFHRTSTNKTNEYEFTLNNPFVVIGDNVSTVTTVSTVSTIPTVSTNQESGIEVE